MRGATGDFGAWLDRFFAAYYEDRPVSATFIGVHDFDDRLPDYSDDGAGAALARMQSLLHESDAFDHARLDATERVDLRLARGFLRTQLWEHGSPRFHRGNPSLYTGEAVFGLI